MHWTPGPGRCTRTELLRITDGAWRYETTGYFGTWGIEAARDAVAADAGLVMALCDDPDPQVRAAAAYAAAIASERVDEIRSGLHTRFRIEANPAVRAGLILAIAQLSHEPRDPACEAWSQALWSDPAMPPAVRVSAAMGWLYLTDTPVPDALHTVLETCATEETARLMEPLPWMRAVDYDGGTALRRCLRGLLHPEDPEPQWDDPWAAPPTAT
ncbi:hypothetical protein Slala03_71610 [Streptomyces lavendulae subsp. lavendulae]|uniref:hypothetical protein n=1 Tax=Streptomyces lavendulae TaxID=1914 RepID=UPI0024A49366|nr:hypothetical protein [Streptomyces lavendulae]GLV87472.1 hypothetical protein Slala03_71610 [Streptomyces lavendulae subsp. lavendulae]